VRWLQTLLTLLGSSSRTSAFVLSSYTEYSNTVSVRPIEASVVLLPIFEFLRANPTFSGVFLEYISPKTDENLKPTSSRVSAPPYTILTLSSYILTHATSTSSPRSIAYANLCLNILLAYVENDGILNIFCQPTQEIIRLCRQVLMNQQISMTL